MTVAILLPPLPLLFFFCKASGCAMTLSPQRRYLDTKLWCRINKYSLSIFTFYQESYLLYFSQFISDHPIAAQTGTSNYTLKFIFLLMHVSFLYLIWHCIFSSSLFCFKFTHYCQVTHTISVALNVKEMILRTTEDVK